MFTFLLHYQFYNGSVTSTLQRSAKLFTINFIFYTETVYNIIDSIVEMDISCKFSENLNSNNETCWLIYYCKVRYESLLFN